MNRSRPVVDVERSKRLRIGYDVVLGISLLASLWMIRSRVIVPAPGLWTTGSNEGHAAYYLAQMRAILTGSFLVPEQTLGGECYNPANGVCTGYFGVAPSLLRAPAALFGADVDLTTVSMALALLVIVIVPLAVLRAGFPRLLSTRTGAGTAWATVVTMSAAALAVGPLALVFGVVRRDVADEAILWSVAFALMTAALVLLAMEKPRAWPLWLAVVTGALAANSRPSAGFGAAALGVVVLLHAARLERNGSRLAAGAALAVLPLLTMLTAFWLKFGTPVPDQSQNVYIAEMPMWQRLREANDGSTFSWRFVPTHMWDFLRPDAVLVQFNDPHAAAPTLSGAVWPVSADMLYREPAGSLTAIVPLALALTVVALIVPWLAGPSLGGRTALRWASLVTAGLGVSLLVTWAHIAMANRYLADAWPMLAIGTVTGAMTVALLTQRHRALAIFGAVAAVAGAGWSAAMLYLLPW